MTNKQKLIALMDKHNLTYSKTAQILQNALHDTAPNLRTIQKWTAPTSTASSTACPAWAIYVLEREIKNQPD